MATGVGVAIDQLAITAHINSKMRNEAAVPEAVQRVIGVLKRLRVFLIAGAIVLLIVVGLCAYSGIWPPLVVVESNSMQHSATTSYIGVIDTGDLVIMKKVAGLGEIRTYLDGVKDGYQTYSENGDVVIYRPLGTPVRTPVIHRALCTVEYNQTGNSFDIPALKDVPASMWSVAYAPKTWYDLKTQVNLTGIGYDQVTVKIDLKSILTYFASQSVTPHGGIITLGDNNHGVVDQSPMASICREPVKVEWIEGVARGELPWFGLLKLWITGPSPEGKVPENSKTDLFVCLALIIGIPIAIDVGGVILERKGIDAKAWLKSKLHLRCQCKGKKEDGDDEMTAPTPEEPPTKPEPKKQPQKGKKSAGKNKSHAGGHRHGKKRRR